MPLNNCLHLWKGEKWQFLLECPPGIVQSCYMDVQLYRRTRTGYITSSPIQLKHLFDTIGFQYLVL